MTLAEALPIVSALSLTEKLQLIEVLAVQVRGATPVPPGATASPPGEPGEAGGSGRLFGILADQGPVPAARDLDEMRQEMWGQFPREDP